MKFFKKITEFGWEIASTIATIITSAITTVLSIVANGTTAFYIFIGLFLISVSAVLIQVLGASYMTNESLNNMKIEKHGILKPSLVGKAHESLVDLVNKRSADIEKIKIICYGTSAYGDFINNIKKGIYPRSADIKLEVMFCSPECVYKDSARDKQKIQDLVDDLKKTSNITVCYTKFLPTIRGCIVYGKKNKVLWNCLQFYSYSEELFSSADYNDFYALIGSENSEMLNINAEIIDKEYNRLKGEVVHECTK